MDAVEVTVLVQASRETVFRFLSDPERMTRWLGAAVEMEPRAGGLLRVRFDRFGTVVRGAVVALEPPARAVYAWGVEAGPQRDALPPGSTRVTITLDEESGGTRVTLRHEGLPSEQERREHEGGWRYYAGRLEELARAAERAPRVVESVDGFVRAWAVPDDAERRALLAACVTPDVRFEDEHVALSGIDGLDAHVGALQRTLPGLALVRSGAPRMVRDHVLFPWRIEGPGGAVVATGVDLAELDATCRLRRVIGFADGAT